MSSDVKLEQIDPQHAAESPQPQPYSAFSTVHKRGIVALIAFAGCLSALSSFIYFPAIPDLAKDLRTTTENINLTVTAYLIVSGVAPAIVGDAADTLGRRPTIVVCLAIYVGANVGLALQSSFGLLLALRMLQSAGISGAYAITYGVIGDLFTRSERGGIAGVVSLVLNTPPSLGPVLSGLLMQQWDWRAIFWFLTAASSCCLAAIIFFLPETSRLVVGDGTVSPLWQNRPIWNALVPKTKTTWHEEVAMNGSFRFPNPMRALKVLGEPGTFVAICVMAVYYTIYSCLQASLSSLLVDKYSTSSLVTGLAYLPFGVGCAIGAVVSGKILDVEYRRTATKHEMPLDSTRRHDLLFFPIEEARLGIPRYSLLLCCLLIAGYGWTIQLEVHMAVPLVLQFLIGLTMQGVFTAISTLLVDTHPDESASAQAANNLVRCATAGGGLAMLEPVIQQLGAGWAFVIAALSGLLALALLFWLRRSGLSWRLNSSLRRNGRD